MFSYLFRLFLLFFIFLSFSCFHISSLPPTLFLRESSCLRLVFPTFFPLLSLNLSVVLVPLSSSPRPDNAVGWPGSEWLSARTTGDLLSLQFYIFDLVDQQSPLGPMSSSTWASGGMFLLMVQIFELLWIRTL